MLSEHEKLHYTMAVAAAKGKTYLKRKGPDGEPQVIFLCKECDGAGMVNNHICKTCQGRGFDVK